MRERHRRDRDGVKGSAQFAATPIDLARPDDAKYAQAVLPVSRAQSKSSWEWHDKIGEIHYAVGRSARIGGYANLHVHKLEKNGEVGEQVTTGLIGEIADQMYSPYGGTRGLLERFLTLMKVPADAYLVQCPDRSGGYDGIDFLSADEIRSEDPTMLQPGLSISRITLPAASKFGAPRSEERVLPADFIGRVWRPSSRYVDVPDSPLLALDTTCEMLHLLTLGIRATLMSRLLSNGVFYVPSEVNEARSAAPSGEAGEFHQNPVLNELLKAAMYAAQNPGEAPAGLPVFMTGPGVHGEQFRHIIMDQALAETDMKLRAELINRLLMGLDIQPTQVSGSGDTNHWGSWAANDDEIKVAIKPDLETGCWALTRLFLWKKMQDAGRKPGEIMRHVVWYDLDNATSHTNIAEDSRQLVDRILISPSAARRMNGVRETDAPDDTEYIRQLGVKMSDPYLATFGMDAAKKLDWKKVGNPQQGPVPKTDAQPSEVGPGVGNPGSPNDIKADGPKRLRPVQ